MINQNVNLGLHTDSKELLTAKTSTEQGSLGNNKATPRVGSNGELAKDSFRSSSNNNSGQNSGAKIIERYQGSTRDLKDGLPEDTDLGLFSKTKNPKGPTLDGTLNTTLPDAGSRENTTMISNGTPRVVNPLPAIGRGRKTSLSLNDLAFYDTHEKNLVTSSRVHEKTPGKISSESDFSTPKQPTTKFDIENNEIFLKEEDRKPLTQKGTVKFQDSSDGNRNSDFEKGPQSEPNGGIEILGPGFAHASFGDVQNGQGQENSIKFDSAGPTDKQNRP